MAKILVYPSEILRRKVDEVTVIDKKTVKEILELKKMLAEGENAAGLAATQIGVSKNFFGIKNSGKVSLYFNPRVIKTWGERVYPKLVGKDNKEEDFLEGCFSVPDYFGTVKRWLKLEVEWQELIGNKLVTKRKKMEGFEAIVWQHESDHLKGILFIDYIKKEGGKFYKWNGNKMVESDIGLLY